MRWFYTYSKVLIHLGTVLHGPSCARNESKRDPTWGLFFSFLRKSSLSNVAKQLMVCQPESTPKMSWPHKTHLALLAGPYLVTNIESDEWFLSMKSEFFESFLTYEPASLPACRSLQGWCHWARVVPNLLLVGGQSHLFFQQGLNVRASMARRFWCQATFRYYRVDCPTVLTYTSKTLIVERVKEYTSFCENYFSRDKKQENSYHS